MKKSLETKRKVRTKDISGSHMHEQSKRQNNLSVICKNNTKLQLVAGRLLPGSANMFFISTVF
jgi:hypothetical protein